MSEVYGAHFGLNKTGFESPHAAKRLRHAENDARFYHSICQKMGGHSRLFIGEASTMENFNETLVELSAVCEPDDVLVLSFSGHGSRVKDINFDEEDEYDEVLVLYDGIILDDLIKVHLSRFAKGVNIFYITDCCYSGTISKALDEEEDDEFIERGFISEVAQEVFDSSDTYRFIKRSINEKAITVSASVIHLAACQEDERAWDGNAIMEHGLLTYHVLKTWQNGRFEGNYGEFFSKIKNEMIGNQTPRLNYEGVINPSFNNAKPFEGLS